MIKDIVKKFLYREKYNSETYVQHLRNIGMTIGSDVTIYAPNKTVIDEQYPWMISIGNHVRITQGVVILSHDYSWSVLKGLNSCDFEKGAILGASGSVNIGDNVFIGMNSIILRNVSIGNDVIIGVGSVVTKDCESGYIYAGNPARKIMTTKEYYQKRKKAQLTEAKKLARGYQERYGKLPPREVFHEYFMLFTQENDLNECFINKMHLCENYEDSVEYMRNNESEFKTYNDFLRYCFGDVGVQDEYIEEKN